MHGKVSAWTGKVLGTAKVGIRMLQYAEEVGNKGPEVTRQGKCQNAARIMRKLSENNVKKDGTQHTPPPPLLPATQRIAQWILVPIYHPQVSSHMLNF